MSATSWAIVLSVLIAVVVALGIGLILLENPSRLERFRRTRRWTAIGSLVVTVGLVLAVVVQTEAPPIAQPISAAPSNVKRASLATVLGLVAASQKIRTVPSNLVPSLSQADALSNLGIPPVNKGCWPSAQQSTVSACTFDGRGGGRTMVLYGDSHAGMWFQALVDIATRAHWKLVALTKGSCPAAPLPSQAPGVHGDWVACDQWHRFAINRINHIHPDLLIISQAAYDPNPSGRPYTPAQWGSGLRQLLIRVRSTRRLVLGDIPGSGGPNCLAQHTDDVQACSLSPLVFLPPYNEAERLAATAEGAQYVDTTPWFCARTCSSVIGNYSAYYLTNHVAVSYSRFLEGVLGQALALSSFR